MVTIRPSRIDPAVGEVACQQFPPMRTRSSGEEVPTPADRSTVAANQPTSILVWLTLSVNTPAGDQRLMINKQRDRHFQGTCRICEVQRCSSIHLSNRSAIAQRGTPRRPRCTPIRQIAASR
jgi:hypothetical protein